MADVMFLEHGEFYIWCFALEDGKGTIRASATFERRADFTAGKLLIRGVRHVLPRRFTSEKDAIAAALDMALQKVDAGEHVGLYPEGAHPGSPCGLGLGRRQVDCGPELLNPHGKADRDPVPR
ncbi:MAG TPA: hypothetical protein VLK85_14730 [Ramlibacter sp.]|nr:hypothetical protein [Ramlibacter sp.]